MVVVKHTKKLFNENIDTEKLIFGAEIYDDKTKRGGLCINHVTCFLITQEVPVSINLHLFPQ
jgi:hypothetical protein